jgi:biogenesis of lysosome-related organelles complex 1 subunit 1
VVEDVNIGISEVFLNQQMLESEAKKLHEQATKFSKQSTQWLQLTQNLNTNLKELGDIENWADHLNEDVQIILKSVDQILINRQGKN